MGFIVGRKDGIGVRIHEYPSDIIKICLVTCIHPYQSLPFWTEVEVEYRGSDSSAWTAMNHKVNSQLKSREPRSRMLRKLKSHIEWQNAWTSRLQYQTRYHWTPPKPRINEGAGENTVTHPTIAWVSFFSAYENYLSKGMHASEVSHGDFVEWCTYDVKFKTPKY